MNIRIVKNLVEMASGYHDAILYSGNFLHLSGEQYVDIVIDNKDSDGDTTFIYTDIHGSVHQLTSSLPQEYLFRLTDVSINNIAVVHSTVTGEDIAMIENDPEILINTVLTGTDYGLSFEPSKIITMHPCNEGLIGGYSLSELVTDTSAIIQGYSSECRTTYADIPYGIQNLLFSMGPTGVIYGFSSIDELDFKYGTGYIDTRWKPTTSAYTIIEVGTSGFRAYTFEDGVTKFYLNGVLDSIVAELDWEESLKIRNIPIDGSDNNDRNKSKVKLFNRALTAEEIEDEYDDSVTGVAPSTFITVSTNIEQPPRVTTSTDGAFIGIKHVEGTTTYRVWSNDPLANIEIRDPVEGGIVSIDVITLPSSMTSMKDMFSTCSAITIDLSKVILDSVTDMSGLFKDCANLDTVLFGAELSTNNVTDMSSMFFGCEVLTTADLSTFNTFNVIDMSYMFYKTNASGVVAGIVNTGAVNDMSFMFAESTTKGAHLERFDLSSLMNVESMYENCTGLIEVKSALTVKPSTLLTNVINMFKGCTSLVNVELDKLFTGNVTHFDGMFNGCTSLAYTELKDSFTSSSAVSMKGMFKDCSTVPYLGLGDLDTSSVTDFSEMFSGCFELTGLYLNNFNTSAATDMSRMFYRCSAFKDIITSASFNTSQVTSFEEMFAGCASLKTVHNPGFATAGSATHMGMFNCCSTLTCISKLDTSNSTDTTDLFRGCDVLSSPDEATQSALLTGTVWEADEPCAAEGGNGFKMLVRATGTPVFESVGNALTITPFVTANASYMVGTLSTTSEGYWMVEGDQDITQVYVEESTAAADIIAVRIIRAGELTSTSRMFYNCINLIYASLDGINSADIVDTTSMFHNCNTLIEIDTPADTAMFSKVEDASRMFYGCHKLAAIPVLGDMTSLVNGSFMFSECRGISIIDKRATSLINLKKAISMFEGCSNLKYIWFNTSETIILEEADSMFAKCISLDNLPTVGLDFSNVTDFTHFMYGCESTVCLGDVDFTNKTISHHMFDGCIALTAPDTDRQVTIIDGSDPVWDNTSDCVTSGALYHVIVHSAVRPHPIALDINMEVVEGVFAVIPSGDERWEIMSNTPTIQYHVLSVSTYNANVITSVEVVNFDNVISTRFMLLNEHILNSFIISDGCASSLLTDTSCMFADKNLATSVDFTHLDTSGVKNMSKMFSYPSVAPGYLNAYSSTLDTAAVEDMSYMFYGADISYMDNLDLDGLDTTSAITMEEMFAYCKVPSIIVDFSGLNIDGNVTSLKGMFKRSNIIGVDFSGVTGSSVETMESMFEECSDLLLANNDGTMLSNGNLKSLSKCYKGCKSLRKVHLPSFTGAGVEDLYKLFAGCTKLEAVYTDAYPPNVVNASRMFKGCKSLVMVYHTPLNSVMAEMDNMFNGCKSLQCIHNIDTVLDDATIATTIGMFDGCDVLEQPSIAEQDSIKWGDTWVIDVAKCITPSPIKNLSVTQNVDGDAVLTWESLEIHTTHYDVYNSTGFIGTANIVGAPDETYHTITFTHEHEQNEVYFVRAWNAELAYTDSTTVGLLKGACSQGWCRSQTVSATGTTSQDPATLINVLEAEFGAGVRILDWVDIEAQYAIDGHLDRLQDILALSPGETRPAGGVTRSGAYSYGSRGYYVSEDGKYYNSGFLVHDRVGVGETDNGGDLLDLGSWYGSREYYVVLP